MATIHQWSPGDRPRERLREKGAKALGDAELVALLVGSGSGRENAVELARRVLSEAGGMERLSRLGMGALTSVTGLGEAKASRIVAAVELGVRIASRRAGPGRRRFTCSADIWQAYRARLEPLLQEVFLVVGLNNKNEALREEVVAKGSVDECMVAPREVFRPMIVEAATRIVVLHNHPSGDPCPSPQDVALTRRLAEAGWMVGIELLDHLVVGRSSYVSLRDRGLLGGAKRVSQAASPLE